MPSRRRLSLLVLVLVALLAVTGCQADATVTLEADRDGGGRVEVSVELDEEALDAVGGVGSLRAEDLREAGWTVDDTVELDDGGAVMSASRPFASPAELGAVLEEVSGPGGPYAQLGLDVDRPFARSQFRLEGVLDGSVGVDAFADPGVASALDGLPFGQDLDALEADLGAPPGSFVNLRLLVSLPGDMETPAATGGESGGAVDVDGASDVLAWETDLAATSPVPVLATSEVIRYRPLAFAAAAAGLALLLVVLLVIGLVVWLRRRRRRRRAARVQAREHAAREAAVSAAAPPEGAAEGSHGAEVGAIPATAAPAGAPQEEAPGLEMVVVGGPGAAFGARDEVDDLVAFARAHGSRLEYPRIANRYADASRGRLSTAELWEALGVEGDPAALDDDMLGRYQLTPGLRDFVERARERGYRVAYLGDGPAAWATHLRRSFRLGELIDPWVVSSDVGATLPELAMFEALRRISGVEPANTLLIDDRLRVLEAARELGYGTAWFTPSGRATEAPGHSIIRSFADLLAG